MTEAEYIAANAAAPTPPGFCMSREPPEDVRDFPYIVRSVPYWTNHECRHVDVPRGEPIANDALKAFYWSERDLFADILAEAARTGHTLDRYALVSTEGDFVAKGMIEPEDDADVLAWLATMFAMRGWTIAFDLPDNFDKSRVRDRAVKHIPGGAS